MKIIYYLISVILAFNALSINATENNFFSEQSQIPIIATIIESQTDKIWPGYNLKSKPIFITYDNGHIYAFNFNSSDPRWQKKIINRTTVLFSDVDQFGLTNAPMQFDFAIENTKAFVFRMDVMKQTPFMPFFVMVHERFHVHQIEFFASEQDSEQSSYRESQNIENLSLMQLEELVLLDFLKALIADCDEAIIKTLKTYISINKKRRELLSSASKDWEARQQMVEGLADYVSAKNLDVFRYFGPDVGKKHLLHTMRGYTRGKDITERALKWRHYGVGASIAYALDYLEAKNWKESVEKNVSLQSILEKNLHVSVFESKHLFEEAKIGYGYENIKIQVNKKVSEYNNIINFHLNYFENQDGVTINLQSPRYSGLSAGGKSRAIYSLSDGSMLSVDDTSKTSSPDNHWYLELSSVPQLFQSNDGFRRFKDDSNIEIIVDGKRELLENLQNREFNDLTLNGNTCTFKASQCRGMIHYENKEMTITFE